MSLSKQARKVLKKNGINLPDGLRLRKKAIQMIIDADEKGIPLHDLKLRASSFITLRSRTASKAGIKAASSLP
jgi:hypothetical protein